VLVSKPYKRKDGMWVATIENGWTAKGTRHRITVSAKTEAACKRRLRDKALEVEQGLTGTSARATVKAWADQWLAMKERILRPKAYNAARTAVRVWIVPTIGRKRLTALSPADARAVTEAILKADRAAATANGAHRTLLNMLRDAAREGHAIPQSVLLAKAPPVPNSDRQPLSIPEALACLSVAAELPHGTRWVFALLHGMRQGECLGTTWDAIDFEAGEVVVEWQLQRLNYRDPKDKAAGFRVPPHLEVRHLRGGFHLTRPKSRAGLRVVPLVAPVLDSLARWRDVAPPNPWGLVWPSLRGTPALHTDDLEEWHAIQGSACVGHPTGRYYHVHECRNLTATQLRDADVDPLVIKSLLGHSDIATSQAYMRVDRPARLDALEKVAGALGIG
jgi:integrase